MSAPQLKQPFKAKGNHTYYICWTEGRRSLRLSTGETKMAAAKTFLGQWLLMEKEQPQAGAVFTVSDLWKLYKAKHVDVKTASPATLDFSWKNLEPHFGKLTVSQVDQNSVEEYESKRVSGKLGRKAKPATVRRELITMKACLNWAADAKRKIITAGSLEAFDLPKDSPPRDRWLTIKEVDLLVATAEKLRRGPRLSRAERFIWLALYTGARKGAICDLTWDRVDFQTGVIHYKVPGAIPTKKRRTSVPIADVLMPVLKRMYDERESNLVMDNRENIWRALSIVTRHAGLKDVTPHTLRHTAATHMARGGVPIHKIANVLGNTVSVVEKVYAHHCPESLREAVASISGGPYRGHMVRESAHFVRHTAPNTTDTDPL